MGKSKIEWTDKVWNPVTGCTKVSEGCRNCYAERMSKRLAGRCGYDADEPFKVTMHFDRLQQPKRWRASKVFVCSMGDLFHEDVSFLFIDLVMDTIRNEHRHQFQILTKRPSRVLEFLKWRHDFYFGLTFVLPKNAWIGTSVEDQATADERIPHLLKTPAAVRFVSYEPALGPLNFSKVPGFNLCGQAGLDLLKNFWVIMGGESGPGARPMHPAWARSVRDQCVAAGVPFLFKQWGEWGPIRNARIDDLLDSRREVIVLPSGGLTSGLLSYSETDWVMRRVGKRAAGRTLDGVVWDQYPEKGGKE